MNQCLKDVVYRKGTQKQLNFLAAIGGMNNEEKLVFQLIHDGNTDLYIQEELCLSRKAYERIEESVRAKLLIAIFECINQYMDKYEP